MNPTVTRRFVPYGRIAFGSLCVIAPGVALRSLMLKPQDNPDGRLLIRVFGSRAFVIGVLSSGLNGPEATRRALNAGAVMDLVDLGSMAIAQRTGRLGTSALAWNTVIGLTFSAFGFLGARAT